MQLYDINIKKMVAIMYDHRGHLCECLTLPLSFFFYSKILLTYIFIVTRGDKVNKCI